MNEITVENLSGDIINKEKIPYYLDNSRVSRSTINDFKKSPKRFKDRIDGKIPNESTPAMENGTMRHAYLLQPNEFKSMYKALDFVAPTSAQQKKFCADYIQSKATTAILKSVEALKSNYVTTGKTDEVIATTGLEMALKLKDYIKWLRSNENGQKTMTWSQFNSLKITKENVLLHKKAKELILTIPDSPEIITHNEFHINWEYSDENNLRVACKSLIDRLIIDHTNKVIKLIDIKTTISLSDFAASFEKYDYGQQMAFYWMAICWYFKHELKLDIEEYTNETYIVAIENGSNEVRVFTVPDQIILTKVTEITQVLAEMDWHFKSNLWDYTREYYEGDGSESLLHDIMRQ